MFIKTAKRFSHHSKEQRDVIDNEILDRNIRNLIFFSYIAIPIHFFHILFFFHNFYKTDGVTRSWRVGIIISHLIIMLFFIARNAVLHLLNKKTTTNKTAIKTTVYVSYIATLLFGCSLVVIDQMVTPAITPFVMICILIPQIILIEPHLNIALNTLVYATFWFLMPLTQHDPALLLSNRVNALSAIAFSIALGTNKWRLTLQKDLQSRTITQQRKELEGKYKQQIEMSKELQKANETKNKLFSIIAHDLRGPIGSTCKLLDLLIQRKPDGELLLKNLKIISQSQTSIYDMLENLLAWAQQQQCTIKFSPKTYNYHRLIAENCRFFAQYSTLKDITLHNNVDHELEVFCDRDMILTVLRNLMNNSIKFTNQKGNIWISTVLNNNEIITLVEDDGVGIDDNHLQMANSGEITTSPSFGTSGEKGVGLGLTLCKEFLTYHNGSLSARKRKPSGTIFSFTLPVNRDVERRKRDS